MKDTGPHSSTTDLQDIYAEERAAVIRHQNIERGQAAALAYAAFATSHIYQESTLFQLAGTAAKYFCYAMAVVIPVLLAFHI